MKTLMLTFSYLFIFFITLVLSGCKGDDGEAGINGNSNIKIITLPTDDITWVLGNYLGRESNVFTLTDAQVNQDIINHGIVLGYAHYKTSTLDTWFLLPLDYEQDASHNTEYIKFTVKLNTINLYAFSSTTVSSPPSSVIPEYRFMLITDKTINTEKSTFNNTALNMLEYDGVNYNDYKAVCSYFDINP